MDAIRARLDAIRGRSPVTDRHGRTERAENGAFNDERFKFTSRDADAFTAPASPTSPFATDDDARVAVDTAIERLEALSTTMPAVKSALELVERDAAGRVTTASFARVAEALKEISDLVASRGVMNGEKPTITVPPRSPAGGMSSLGSSPRIVSPGGLRRSTSPIGPARRVRVDGEDEDVREVPSQTNRVRVAVNDRDEDDEVSAARFREWGEHVRATGRATEHREVENHLREDMIEQYRAFLQNATPPRDPFIAALAEQMMNSIREKEEMTQGVHRARQMIEALAESDKAKTLAIERLCEEIERMGGQVPDDVDQLGVQWAPGAFDEQGLDDDE